MNVGLHILIGSAAYHPLPGGGERYVRSLAHELVAQGCRVTVLTSSAETEADFWNGTSTHETVHDGQITVIRLPVRKMVGGRSGLLAWRKAMVTLSMATNAVRPLQWMSRQTSIHQQTCLHQHGRCSWLHAGVFRVDQ